MTRALKKKSFIFNVEWQEILLDYPSEVRLEVYDAIIEYVASGTLSELKPMAKMAFSFIKKEIDSNNGRYNDIVEMNRSNGCKGGNPNFRKGQPNPYYNGEGKITEDNQTLPKITEDNPINDNDNVNDINTIIISDEIIEKDKSFSPETARDGGNSGRTDYDALMAVFNNVFAGRLQTVRVMTDSRKRAVEARMAQYGPEAVRRVFDNVLASPFLLGDNDRGWRADFDWIFKQQNFTKILEGNYDRGKRPGYRGPADTAAERRRREAEALVARLLNEE